MRTSPVFIFACIFGVILSNAPSFAQEGPAYDVLEVRVPGVTLLPAAGDINGDGQIDLLLFNKPSKESRDKFCSVYLQRDGRLEVKPDFEIHVGENIGVIEVVDLDADGKDELIGIDGDGVALFRFSGAATIVAKRIISQKTVFPPNSKYLAAAEWYGDLTGDGEIDLLVPVVEGMRLFAQNHDFTFREVRTFEFPLYGSVGQQGDQHFITCRIPAIFLSDFDGDGNGDLGAFDLERMDFFLSNGSSSLDQHKSAPLLRKFTKDFVGASSFADLNGDNIPDAALVLVSQKRHLQSEAQIYFGKEDFSYPERPDHVYASDSSLIFPIFIDADGDGKMEMLLQDIDVGITFFINYFIRNRIRVTTQLRRIGRDGRFEEKPASARTIYIEAGDSGSEPARAGGDFNGDGLEDFVVGTAEDRLSFFLSRKGDLLPSQPAAEFDAPSYGAMTTLKLNADDRTDFVILYSDEDKENLAVVFRSR